MDRLGKDKNYKDTLLEKRVSGIADVVANVIFLLCAVMTLIYMLIENKITSDNYFYIILIILVIIHTSVGLLKFSPKNACSLLTGSIGNHLSFKLIR